MQGIGVGSGGAGRLSWHGSPWTLGTHWHWQHTDVAERDMHLLRPQARVSAAATGTSLARHRLPVLPITHQWAWGHLQMCLCVPTSHRVGRGHSSVAPGYLHTLSSMGKRTSMYNDRGGTRGMWHLEVKLTLLITRQPSCSAAYKDLRRQKLNRPLSTTPVD